MKFSETLLNIRKNKKINQEDLADELKVTRQTISNWENNKSYPDLETLVLISNKFNISLDELLKGDKKIMKTIDKKVKTNKYLKIIICMIIIVLLGIGMYLGINQYNKKRQTKLDNERYNDIIDNINYLGFTEEDTKMFYLIVENEIKYRVYKGKEELINDPYITASTKWAGSGSIEASYDGTEVIVYYLEEQEKVYLDIKGNLLNQNQNQNVTGVYNMYQEKTINIVKRMTELYKEVFQ